MPFYILLGILAGLISVYHSRIFFKIESGLSKGIKNEYARILFSGLLLAGLISVFPSLFGEGFQSIKYLAEQRPHELFNNSVIEYLGNNEIVILLFVGLLIFLKTIATALTIGGGGNGGNFAPSLFIGAYLGFFLSRLMNFLKISELNESNFTLVGMAGILSGLYHAPLTSIFLIAEITNGYALIVPLMIVASIAYAVSRYFEKYSMDAKDLSKRGQMFTDDKDYNVLTSIEVSDFLDRDRATLSPYQTAEDLIDILTKTKDSMFAVIDKNDHLLGLIAVDEIRDKILRKNNM